jgi:hypothetical protein
VFPHTEQTNCFPSCLLLKWRFKSLSYPKTLLQSMHLNSLKPCAAFLWAVCLYRLLLSLIDPFGTLYFLFLLQFKNNFISWWKSKFKNCIKSIKTDNSMTKIKKSSSNSPSTTQKTKNWATQTAPKIGGELRCSGRVRNCMFH